MAVCDAYVFPSFLTPVQTRLSFQSHRLLFSHALRRKEVRLNRVSNSQPPDHESDTLTTEPPGRGERERESSTETDRQGETRTQTADTDRQRNWLVEQVSLCFTYLKWSFTFQ